MSLLFLHHNQLCDSSQGSIRNLRKELLPMEQLTTRLFHGHWSLVMDPLQNSYMVRGYKSPKYLGVGHYKCIHLSQIES
jgi:hypothetical protein